jgi:hypothetical protein
LPKNFLSNEAILKMMEDYIGTSKIIFITAANEWVILNETLGKWVDGNWFSNESYKEVKKPVYSAGFWGRYNNPENYNYGSAYQSGISVGKSPTLFNDECSHANPFLIEDKKSKKQNCDCCDEQAILTYVPEFYIEMCEKCINAYVMPDRIID